MENVLKFFAFRTCIVNNTTFSISSRAMLPELSSSYSLKAHLYLKGQSHEKVYEIITWMVVSVYTKVRLLFFNFKIPL
jgi:hypothetical protein